MNSSAYPRVLLIGCGKMGAALLRGWMRSPVPPVTVVDPNVPDPALQSHISLHVAAIGDLPKIKPFDAVILAVKPAQIDDVCASLTPFITGKTVIVSIAAGRTLDGIMASLPPAQSVIRAMPNLPASIGQGITVMVANSHVTIDQKSLGRTLLLAAGKVVAIDDEALMDSVTAVSGSGPAYIFALIDAMAQAGIENGLPPDLAMQLARQTVIGAALLAQAEPNVSATDLRINVTSPGGTTQAALNVLFDQDALQKLFGRAMTAAAERSKELSK